MVPRHPPTRKDHKVEMDLITIVTIVPDPWLKMENTKVAIAGK